jgi:serine/threonine-protein phosphatase 4 regulatory subunit 2
MQNIASLLADSPKAKKDHDTAPPFDPQPSTTGGLKLAPFPSRLNSGSGSVETPKLFLSDQEADEAKESIFSQLDSFDKYAIFICLI